MTTFIKKLVTGKYSLPMTFWGWGFCLCSFLSILKYIAIYTDTPYLIPIRFLLQSIILTMVFSGLIFIIKREKTFLGYLSLFVILIQLIVSIIMFFNLLNLSYLYM